MYVNSPPNWLVIGVSTGVSVFVVFCAVVAIYLIRRKSSSSSSAAAKNHAQQGFDLAMNSMLSISFYIIAVYEICQYDKLSLIMFVIILAGQQNKAFTLPEHMNKWYIPNENVQIGRSIGKGLCCFDFFTEFNKLWHELLFNNYVPFPRAISNLSSPRGWYIIVLEYPFKMYFILLN